MEAPCTDVPWKSEMVATLYRKVQASVAHLLLIYAQIILREAPCSKGVDIFPGCVVLKERICCVTRSG